MDGPIDRLIPQVRILPPLAGGQRKREQTRRRFTLDDESSADADTAAPKSEHASQDHPLDEDRPVGHAADDESGSQLDLTA